MKTIPAQYEGHCMDLESTCEEDHCRCMDVIDQHRATREVAAEFKKGMAEWYKKREGITPLPA